MKEKIVYTWRHWLTIFLCFVLFLVANASTSDSENIILPKLAALNGWDYSLVLSLATVAGVCSVVGNLLLGKLCEKYGGKVSIIVGLLLTACFVFIYGTATSYPVYVFGLIGTICCGQSVSFFGANSVVANWFPKTKGFAMGFISVGPPVGTIVMVSILNTIIAKTSLRGGVIAIVAVLLIMALVSFLLIHNSPEEVGATPDNMPQAKIENETIAGNLQLTTGKILKSKAFWAVTLICGICNMSQTGLMAQWLVRYTGSGYTENQAALMMSVCAVCGIFGSMISGNIENKLGTKKGFMVLAIWFIVALLLNFTNVVPLVYLSVPMFGLSITLYQIFMPAFELSVFGKENFKAVNGLVFPIVCMCGQLTFLVIALCIKAFGEVRFAYIVFSILLTVVIVLSKSLKTN